MEGGFICGLGKKPDIKELELVFEAADVQKDQLKKEIEGGLKNNDEGLDRNKEILQKLINQIYTPDEQKSFLKIDSQDSQGNTIDPKNLNSLITTGYDVYQKKKFWDKAVAISLGTKDDIKKQYEKAKEKLKSGLQPPKLSMRDRMKKTLTRKRPTFKRRTSTRDGVPQPPSQRSTKRLSFLRRGRSSRGTSSDEVPPSTGQVGETQNPTGQSKKESKVRGFLRNVTRKSRKDKSSDNATPSSRQVGETEGSTKGSTDKSQKQSIRKMGASAEAAARRWADTAKKKVATRAAAAADSAKKKVNAAPVIAGVRERAKSLGDLSSKMKESASSKLQRSNSFSNVRERARNVGSSLKHGAKVAEVMVRSGSRDWRGASDLVRSAKEEDTSILGGGKLKTRKRKSRGKSRSTIKRKRIKKSKTKSNRKKYRQTKHKKYKRLL